MEEVVWEERDYVQELVDYVHEDHTDKDIEEYFSDYHDNDIAGAFEVLTKEERKKLYKILGPEHVSEIFTYIEDVEDYIREMDDETAADIISEMDSDDAVDVLEEMDDEQQKRISQLLDEEAVADIKLIKSYEDDQVGSKMTTNFVEIIKNMDIKSARRSVFEQARENDNISTIYVCDEEGKFFGAMDLKDLIIAKNDDELESLVSTNYPYLMDHELITDVIEEVVEYAEDSIPVLNSEHEVIGIITATDVVEVVDDEMGEDYAKLAGLTAEEDLNETLKDSMKKRLPWLVALLFLGMGVSSVVGVFETVVAALPIVMAFQSLILDMAGNVGTQSLAVTIRVLMDENLTGAQKIKLVFKEMRVGFANGLLLGIVTFAMVGAYICVLKGYPASQAFTISGCVGIALCVAMVISSLVGTVVPMFFHKIHVDPAVASGPLITTVNDLVAVVTYYGLAWILLINVLHMA